jgi:hypothetical protein
VPRPTRWRSAAAKRRLADEYDAAQQRGDLRKHGQRGKEIGDSNISLPPTLEEAGVDPSYVHEARTIRDAERVVCPDHD